MSVFIGAVPVSESALSTWTSSEGDLSQWRSTRLVVSVVETPTGDPERTVLRSAQKGLAVLFGSKGFAAREIVGVLRASSSLVSVEVVFASFASFGHVRAERRPFGFRVERSSVAPTAFGRPRVDGQSLAPLQ